MAGKIKGALMALGLMALGALGGTAASVHAAPGGPEVVAASDALGAESAEDRRRGRGGKGRAMKRALSKMDLTEEQQTAINGILEQARAERGERSQPESLKRNAMETVDRAAAHAALAERHLRAQKRLDVRLDILEVLTPAQRAELARRVDRSRRTSR